jgi:hypothetical protein
MITEGDPLVLDVVQQRNIFRRTVNGKRCFASLPYARDVVEAARSELLCPIRNPTGWSAVIPLHSVPSVEELVKDIDFCDSAVDTTLSDRLILQTIALRIRQSGGVTDTSSLRAWCREQLSFLSGDSAFAASISLSSRIIAEESRFVAWLLQNCSVLAVFVRVPTGRRSLYAFDVKGFLAERTPFMNLSQLGMRLYRDANRLPSQALVATLLQTCTNERERGLVRATLTTMLSPSTIERFYSGLDMRVSETVSSALVAASQAAQPRVLSEAIEARSRAASQTAGRPAITTTYPLFERASVEFFEQRGLVASHPRLSSDVLFKSSSQMSLARWQKALKEHSDIGAVISRSTLHGYTEPVRVDSRAASSHSPLFHVRFKVPKKDGGLAHIDTHYARAESVYLRDWLAVPSATYNSSDKSKTVLCNEISMDDKAVIHTGGAAVVRQRRVWQSIDEPIHLETYDFAALRATALQATAFVNVRPDTDRATELQRQHSLGRSVPKPSLNGGKGLFAIRIYSERPSNAAQHLHDLLCIMERQPKEFVDPDTGVLRPRLLLRTDGGPDVCPRFDGPHMMHSLLFWALDLDCLVAKATAPHDSKINSAERLNAQATLELSGLQFPDNDLPRALRDAASALSGGTFSGMPIDVCAVRADDSSFFTCMDQLYHYCSLAKDRRQSFLRDTDIRVVPTSRLLALRRQLGLRRKIRDGPMLRDLMGLHGTHGTTTRYTSLLARCGDDKRCATCTDVLGGSLRCEQLCLSKGRPSVPQPLRDRATALHYMPFAVRALLVDEERASQPWDEVDCHRPALLVKRFVDSFPLDALPVSDVQSAWLALTARKKPKNSKMRNAVEELAAECCYDLDGLDANVFVQHLEKMVRKRRTRLLLRKQRAGNA